MALAHKGLNAESLPWWFTEKEAIAFSGQGAVPVLVDDGETVSDSWRIALHLEARYPDTPSLFAGAVPIVQFVNAWADGALLTAIAQIILLDICDCLDPANRAYFRASREKRFGQSLEAVVSNRAANLSALRKALAPLREVLRERGFLSGDAHAYADYCVFGMFMWARAAPPKRHCSIGMTRSLPGVIGCSMPLTGSPAPPLVFRESSMNARSHRIALRPTLLDGRERADSLQALFDSAIPAVATAEAEAVSVTPRR
jgi:glutathione S-transferase